MNARPRFRSPVYGALLVALILTVQGCSAPSAVDRDNRKVVDAILTAITMKNSNWLDDDAQLAEDRHEEGQITDDEHEQLVAIIEKARSGDWQGAEKDAYQFRKAHPFVADGK